MKKKKIFFWISQAIYLWHFTCDIFYIRNTGDIRCTWSVYVIISNCAYQQMKKIKQCVCVRARSCERERERYIQRLTDKQRETWRQTDQTDSNTHKDRQKDWQRDGKRQADGGWNVMYFQLTRLATRVPSPSLSLSLVGAKSKCGFRCCCCCCCGTSRGQNNTLLYTDP